MKIKIIFFLFCGVSFFTFSQIQKDIRNHNVFFNVDYYLSGLIQPNIDGFGVEDSVYNTFGFSSGTDISISENERLSLKWKLGYRYIYQYDYLYVGDFSSHTYSIEDYHGGFMGPNILFGKKNKIELGFLLGFGRMKSGSVTRADAEGTVSLGYVFDVKNNFNFRLGSSLNLGRDLFYRPWISFYSGATYDIKTQHKKKKYSDNNDNYFAFGLTAYILNLQLNLIGVGGQLDYFFYNGEVLDFGISSSYKIGIDYNEDIKSDLSVFPTALFGKGEDKFELFLGPNLTFGEYSEKHFYNFVNFGMGYRVSSELIHVRLGISTTSFVYGSLGFNF
jgi:hypothetical protein